jgi:hypothetical protein
MLRLTITTHDVVHVCLAVEDAQLIIEGSIVTRCAECDRAILHAPGQPLAKVGEGGTIEPITGIIPPPTLLLCIPCAKMHLELAGMRLG